MRYSYQCLASVWTQAIHFGAPEGFIEYIITDSRVLVFPQYTCFFALPGENTDGHRFISELISKGVKTFVVSQPEAVVSDPNLCFFLVEDVLKALQDLAIFHRSQFQIPVIGITGSNGKTTVKEWLFILLGDRYRIVKSPGSYNSQIGVALSILQMDKRHQLGIFEAGISKKGEMARLAEMIACDIGVFVNLGAAHDEGFSNRSEKLIEKNALFSSAKTIIYHRDFTDLHTLVSFSIKKSVTWGYQSRGINDPDFIISERKLLDTKHTRISGTYKGNKVTFDIPFETGVYLENAILCILVAMHMGCEEGYIQERLHFLKPLPLRLELLQGLHNTIIINDSYSNDPESLTAAMEFMDQHAGQRKRILVLSDFKQSNQSLQTSMEIVKSLIDKYQVDEFLGYGSIWQELPLQNGARKTHVQSFTSLQKLEDYLQQAAHHQPIILIKGARMYRLERIAEKLSAQKHKTRLEINLDHLAFNIRHFRQKLAPTTKLMIMLKANAYGSGDLEMIHFFENQNIDYVAVAYLDEAVRLRKSGMKYPIMVLNTDIQDLDLYYTYDIEPEIFSLDQLSELQTAIEAQNSKQLKIHLKLDSGMHRLGFEAPDIEKMSLMIKQMLPYVKIQSIFTHLIASENDAADTLTVGQIQKYLEMYEKIVAFIPYRPMRHVLNTEGIMRFPAYQMEMVRLGIGMYGVNSDRDNLKPVHSLKASVAQIKWIDAGETVGYGAKFFLKKKTKVATITIGYADGLMRLAGMGKYRVFVNGKLAPIIGNICMDLCMIDVTDIEAVQSGDEVEIFGYEIPVTKLAQICQTIPYEILSRISSRVKRVYTKSW